MPKKINYSEIELIWIRTNCTMPRRDAWQAFLIEFARNDISYDNYCSLCKRNKWNTGRDGKFAHGIIGWNKGQKMPYNANSAKTQFKKGVRAANAFEIGQERLNHDGYVLVCIGETNPYTGAPRRLVFKHRYLWEKLHGKISRGNVLKCIDGNRQNCDPSNWELISFAVLARLSVYKFDQSPNEVKPAIFTTAKIKQLISEKQRKLDG